ASGEGVLSDVVSGDRLWGFVDGRTWPRHHLERQLLAQNPVAVAYRAARYPAGHPVPAIARPVEQGGAAPLSALKALYLSLRWWLPLSWLAKSDHAAILAFADENKAVQRYLRTLQ